MRLISWLTGRGEGPDAEQQAARLMDQVQRGDESALGKLLDLLVDDAYGVAFRMLRQPRDAEELVNEVFVRLWHQRADFDPDRGSVQAWLHTMIRSACLDRLRRRRRRDGLVAATAPADLGYAQPAEPEGMTEQLLRRRLIEQALGRLSEAQRRVLNLAYFEDLSHQEIAERLQMPIGTVKSHCRRGMERMRDLMAPQASMP